MSAQNGRASITLPARATTRKIATVQRLSVPMKRKDSKPTLTERLLLKTVNKLRKAASVANVAMNGGKRKTLIMKACATPARTPTKRVKAIAATIVNEGIGPLLERCAGEPFGHEVRGDDAGERDE